MLRTLCFLPILCLLVSCSPGEDPLDRSHDYFSFANTSQLLTEHLQLDLVVDFDRRELRGSATLGMRVLDADATQIILDTRDLHIERIAVAGTGAGETETTFRLAPEHPRLGQALTIDIPGKLTELQEILVKIDYRTNPGASALQWLPAELTAGKVHPFMFSQSQSIHARSWIPLQDSPSVRITYEATIHTPDKLLAVMSADNDPLTERNGIYRFSMPQAIPSYLLAIAVGNIFFEPIGAQTGIYAEPEMIAAATFEFSGTQRMLETASSIYGPYRWGRYDLLILPPSFPFGGMENPRLSFITPSVLAGDRSLVALIAHELAHSWSGNLVSNRTWRDIWLNEGITSYLDARLMEVLYGKQRADEERLLSYRDLLRSLETVSLPMQALAPLEQLDDPDASQGGLAYQKGQLFLQHLEDSFGRQRFDPFLAGYFDHFAFQSISSEQFLEYLDQHLLTTYPGILDRQQASEWLYRPGIPQDAPQPRSATLEEAERLAAVFALGEVPADGLPVKEWSPQATVHFINSLPASLQAPGMQALDTQFDFSQSRNAEITRAWFTQVAARRHLPAYPAMESYLNRHGRTHLIYPVYMALAGNGEDSGLAHELFTRASPGYHPLTIAAIERGLAQPSCCASQ